LPLLVDVTEASHICHLLKALPKFLRSVPKTDRIAVQEMHRLLNEWAVGAPVDYLELLDARYADLNVRSYAVKHLEKLPNAELEDYLLQLVQVRHDCTKELCND